MEEKRLHISISTILLIIAIIVIIVMGIMIYNLSKSKLNANTEIEQLKAETQSMQTTLKDIQNSLNKANETKNTKSNEIKANGENISSENDTTTNKTKTEKEQVEEIANAFVKAVNEKDWSTVEKYSNIVTVNELKEYNITNMTIDLTTLEKNPNHPDGYYCCDDYDMYYQGSTNNKDFSLGRWFCINKINDSYKVTSFCATGL